MAASLGLSLTDQELRRSLSLAWGVEVTAAMQETSKGSLRAAGKDAVRAVLTPVGSDTGGDVDGVDMAGSTLLTQSTVEQEEVGVGVQGDSSCTVAEASFFRAAWERGVRYGLHTLGRPTALVLDRYRQYGSPLSWPSMGDVGDGAERFRRAFIAAHRGVVYNPELPWVEDFVGHSVGNAAPVVAEVGSTSRKTGLV